MKPAAHLNISLNVEVLSLTMKFYALYVANTT